MHEAPDNRGAFADIYTHAANAIGCTLKIVRYSKRRVHKLLQRGSVDFYPGASYSIERAKYLHFSEIGLMSAEYGLTPLNVVDIQHYKQVKALNLIWLMELGSSKREIADRLDIKVDQTQNLTIEKLIRYFETRDANFYVIDKELIDLFVLNKPPGYLKSLGLKLHKKCCGGVMPMYAGISKKSKHFINSNVSELDFSKDASKVNQTSAMHHSNVLHLLIKELRRMQREGLTEKIYLEHLREH
jgi:hypothetical protein